MVSLGMNGAQNVADLAPPAEQEYERGVARPKPGVAKKRRPPAPPREDLRDRLLAVTLSMIEREDISAISLREVARRAGVTPGAPYHHFPSRSALLGAVAEQGFSTLGEAMNRAAGTAWSATPLDRLAAIGTAYLRFALDHHAHYRVMFLPELSTERAPASLQDAALGTFMRLIDTVNALAPSVSRQQALMASVACWSMAHGFVALWNDGPLARLPSVPDREAMIASVGRLLATAAQAAILA
jgi:AcrR family transcriptional regulator